MQKIKYKIMALVSLNIFLLGYMNYLKVDIDDERNKEVMEEVEDDLLVNKEIYLINPPEDDANYWDFVNSEPLNVNFEDLMLHNKETVGWLKVEGTSINYPIVQTNNNSFYLTHSFDKTKNEAGWVFSDYRNNLDNLNNNTIIYGHRRLDMSMFGSLINVLKKDYLQDISKHFIRLATPNSNMVWQVVSVYTIPKESYYLKTYFMDEDYEEFLNTILKRSIYNFKTKLDKDDKILTLSTCQNNNGDRIVLHAKLRTKDKTK